MFSLMRLFIIAFAGMFLAHALPAAQADETYAFNLPEQPLADALRAVGQQTSTNVMFEPRLVKGLKAPAVRTRVTVGEAIRLLLAGTELDAIETKPGSILILQKKDKPARTSGVQDLSEVRMARADESAGEEETPAGPDADRDGRGLRADGPEILVTGQRIGIINEGVIPRRENEALRYEIIDREELERSGATSLPEFFRQISSVTNYGTGTQQTYGTQLATPDGIGATNDPISLRGLGTQQTLVMINGRRLYGSDSGGPDLSRIPLSAVERIEILQTSGSAIYGANAVGGVINIVLRRNPGGSGEVNLHAGSAAGGAAETRATWYQGFSLNRGQTAVSLIAEARHVEPLHLGDRDYHLRALEKFPRGSADYNRQVGQPFVGPLATVMTPAGTPLGIPGHPDASIAVVPPGSNGALTPADFAATAGRGAESTQRLDRAVLTPGSDSYSLFGTVEHEFSSGLGAYAELSYRYAGSRSSYAGILGVMTMTAVNPFNPFGTTVNVHVDPVDFPDDSVKNIQRTLRAVAGLKGNFIVADRRFNWATDFSWDRNETYASTLRFTQYLRAAVFAGLYNPLRDLGAAPAADEATLANARSRTEVVAYPEVAATNWRMNGELFNAWGGPARFSAGAEYRIEKHSTSQVTHNGPWSTLPMAPQGFADGVERSERRVHAFYGEVTLPVVGERNARRLIRELTFSAAMRMEKYEDVRSAAPPTLAVKYAPVRDLALRASYSEGFQPPNLQSLHNIGTVIENTPVFADSYVDPMRPGLPNGPITVRAGFGNPDLKPEVSETWDAGLILTPRWIPGLTVNASYFRYDKKDVIGVLNFQQIINYFPGYYTRGANLDTDPPGVPGPIDFFETTFFNIANLYTDGWDYMLSYSYEAGSAGVFSVDAAATRTSSFRSRPVPDAPYQNSLGDLGNGASFPLQWRGRLGLNWQRQGWNVSWLARYTDSYVVNSNDPTPDNPTRSGYDGPHIPSTLEHDVQVAYQFSDKLAGTAGWLNRTRITLGALNVFDEPPPYVTNRGQLYHSFFNDPRQRFVYLELRKSF